MPQIRKHDITIVSRLELGGPEVIWRMAMAPGRMIETARPRNQFW